jgi:hypothetical protein
VALPPKEWTPAGLRDVVKWPHFGKSAVPLCVVTRGMQVALRVGDMLKITHVDEKPQTLRLEGDVSGPWVAELRRVCFDTLGHAPERGSHLVLDLGGVSFLDVDGIALFRDLARQQVLFTNRSLFIAEQLKGVSDVDR